MYPKKSSYERLNVTQGMYVIFEGSEASGKSSTMKLVAEAMKDTEIKLTYQPGSTPLGVYLRRLVKYNKEIDPTIEIDPLARQCLYVADAINFVKMVLKPSLDAGETIFSDRSTFITGLIYAIAEGVNQNEIMHLLRTITPPRADKLYILQCPYEVNIERLKKSRPDNTDYYDSQPREFFEKISNIYDNLLTMSHDIMLMVSRIVALENVVYIDATQPQDKVVADIVKDLRKARAVKS